MCVMSVVMDYGRTTWPTVVSPTWAPVNPISPTYAPPEQAPAERDAILKFMDLVRKAAEFDKAADQAHCEDPEKIKLLERIEQRLAAIEQHLGIAAA